VILEKFSGRKAVKKIVDTISPDWWNFSKDPGKFLAAREKLAEQILRSKKTNEP